LYRRKARNSSVENVPTNYETADGFNNQNVYTTLHAQPSSSAANTARLPDDRARNTGSIQPTGSVYHDQTLIDNDLYHDTADPAAKTPSEMMEMKRRPAPPHVYAAVHKNRPNNARVSSSSGPDHDTTLVENDLYTST